jgi:hypothetical protein
MLNDRDQYEGQEESEYHFSDDEANYEVEPETSSKPPVKDLKESIFSHLSSPKRLILSALALVFLIFIVYKMVMPATSAPSTDIIATEKNTSPKLAVSPAAPKEASPAQSPPLAAVVPAQPPTVAASPPAAVLPSVGGNTTPVAAMPSPVLPPQPQPQVVVNVPAAAPQPTTMQAPNETGRIADMVAENDRLISQLHADYTQKINDFNNQNKNLKDQMQMLSARVASMETQMGQLIRALTNQTSAMKSEGEQIAAPAPQAKIAYNVQAIIPGRAWLKSDNGETVTVAEGDLLKGVGRVSKIDPYDGIVEISNGSKVISLSYGSGTE